MGNHKSSLSGVFVPVVTPFRDGRPDLGALRFNLRKLRDTALTGYLALGSNAEFRSLSQFEQMQVLGVFSEEKGDKIVMTGTACESTAETIDRSRLAADFGCDYVSVLTPCYFPKQMTGPVLRDHYTRIADEVPVPVLLYNAPGFAGGVQIPPGTVAELSRNENIVGMKDSSPTGPARFLNVLDPGVDFHVLAGSANFFYPSLHLGAVGGIMSLGNIFPEACRELYQLFIEGRYDDARALHFRLARLNSAISGSWGVAGVKAAMNIAGFKGGEPRAPLQPVPPDEVEAMRAKIRAEGFLEGECNQSSLPPNARKGIDTA